MVFRFFSFTRYLLRLVDRNSWNTLGDPVLHIELRKWADAFLIVPLDANTLAKAAVGLCDNLVSSVIRAWDSKDKPLLVAPAMNTVMWEHSLTQEQLVREFRFVQPTYYCYFGL
jgi:phosphopantothenoylcysteine synthetase/decarboxylase